MIVTQHPGTTWHLDRWACFDREPSCCIEQVLDEVGVNTPHLICSTHGEIVGADITVHHE